MKCLNCGKEFEPKRSHQKFHNKTCSNKYRNIHRVNKPRNYESENFYRLYGIMPTEKHLQAFRNWKKVNDMGQVRDAITIPKGRHWRKNRDSSLDLIV